MSAVLDTPACAPPGTRAVCPAPERCWLCGGAGKDPVTGDLCERCQGGRYEFARFDLKPSRTHELRPVRFEPRPDGRHRLFVWMVKCAAWVKAPPWAEYVVREFACDFNGRAFRVEKVGTNRVHDLFIGADGNSACHCEGETYKSAAKANQKAFDSGGRVYPSRGCVHLDSLAALVRAGWLDG